jgi:hypothetical protein
MEGNAVGFQVFRSRTAAVIAGAAAVAVVSSAGGAIAAGLVTSADIKDDTIRSVDIRDGGVHVNDLSTWLQGRANAVRPVRGLAGDFSATNPSVTMTPDGVAFGPYADGGATGGSVEFTGMNGMTLSDVDNLVYYMRYVATNDTGAIGVPYLRIFVNGDAADAIFSPDTQTPDPDTAQGPFHEWVATSGSWRYQDDVGDGPDQSWQDLVAAHGGDTISGIYITTGFTAGNNLQALLRWMQVNGVTYAFGG